MTRWFAECDRSFVWIDLVASADRSLWAVADVDKRGGGMHL